MKPLDFIGTARKDLKKFPQTVSVKEVKPMTKEIIERGSGNVFADIGVDAPNEMLAKAKLASAILDVIEHRKLTQAKAAKILGTDQAYISKLKRGNELRRFTLDRLITWLTKLDRNVILTVKRKPRSQETAVIQVSV
jgi:predicted XRE-type DNA-binding protein